MMAMQADTHAMPAVGAKAGWSSLLWRAMLLLAVLVAVIVGSAVHGAVDIPLGRLPELLMMSFGAGAGGGGIEGLPAEEVLDDPALQLWQGVLIDIRLPRIVLGVITGAGLALAGAVMQALFRNPLAEPGLVGVSAGGAAGAVGAIVFGFAGEPWVVAAAAFGGSLLATLSAYQLGRGSPGSAAILLAGIAINAFCGALIGVFTYLADDTQLRTLTFWNLGSMAAADWQTLRWLAPWAALMMGLLLARWQALNALLLGEREALHLGFELQRLRWQLILLVALLAGPLVAVTGTIGFVGLVVPHLVRLAVGADHRHLLPLSMLAGAIILSLADWLARIVVIPADLPIGIVTALLGAPFLLMLLRRGER